MFISNPRRNVMSARVIVRGMTKKWFDDHFIGMDIYFGGDPKAVPKDDADFVGFYLEAPDSAITHIGVVESIDRKPGSATFHLKAIIKLDKPIKPGHAIRKHEYWTLEQLGISQLELIFNEFAIARA